jgi:hypothetical protein
VTNASGTTAIGTLNLALDSQVPVSNDVTAVQIVPGVPA